jgi:Uma2 family endonuclease
MTGLQLPPIEDLDVEDLLTLPKGYRYELRAGNLNIMAPATFWHREMVWRLQFMLRMAGLRAYQDPGVLGNRPRDNRLPDVGVIDDLPVDRRTTSYSHLPGSAYRLVVEVVSKNSLNGEYTDKMDWYARLGIPEYWIAEEMPDSDEDAVILIHRLAADETGYVRERSVLLSELEKEYQR